MERIFQFKEAFRLKGGYIVIYILELMQYTFLSVLPNSFSRPGWLTSPTYVGSLNKDLRGLVYVWRHRFFLQFTWSGSLWCFDTFYFILFPCEQKLKGKLSVLARLFQGALNCTLNYRDSLWRRVFVAVSLFLPSESPDSLLGCVATDGKRYPEATAPSYPFRKTTKRILSLLTIPLKNLA